METVNLLPQISKGLTKTEILSVAEASVDNVLESGNPLQALELIACMQELMEAVKKHPRFKDYVLEELSKHGKGLTTSSGAKMELAEVGTKYNYDQCNDKVYFSLLEEKIQLEARIKDREKFLKGLPESGVEVRYDDELVTLYPPSKSSVSSFKITLAK